MECGSKPKKPSIDQFIDDVEKWMKGADGSEPVENVHEEEDVENEISPHDSISNVGSLKKIYSEKSYKMVIQHI